jgi:hypothetical protein
MKILLASLPRAGRNFLGEQLRQLGVSTDHQCLKNDMPDVDVYFCHDFNLTIQDQSRHTILLYRDPEDCLKSWYLWHCSEMKIPPTIKGWDFWLGRESAYVNGFVSKYARSHTLQFSDLIRDPNLILATIMGILEKPYKYRTFTSFSPKSLQVHPFL